MSKTRLRCIAIGIDKFSPFGTYLIREHLNVQIISMHTIVIELKNSNNRIAITHDAYPSLGHCQSLCFNIGKIKTFPEILISKTF